VIGIGHFCRPILGHTAASRVFIADQEIGHAPFRPSLTPVNPQRASSGYDSFYSIPQTKLCGERQLFRHPLEEDVNSRPKAFRLFFKNSHREPPASDSLRVGTSARFPVRAPPHFGAGLLSFSLVRRRSAIPRL
jgi:hypothetical protein